MSDQQEERAEILAAIEEIGRQRLGLQRTLRRESHLVRDLGLDSLKQLSLVVEVEDHFRIALDESDEAEILTVGDLVEVVLRRRTESARGGGGAIEPRGQSEGA